MGKKLDLSQIENAQLTSSGNDSDLAYLKSMGARALPSNPTANNWSADAIKRQLYKQAEVLFEWSKASNEAVSGFASEVDDYLYKLDTGDIVVDKSRKDAEGNTITETYETKEDAKSKKDALDYDILAENVRANAVEGMLHTRITSIEKEEATHIHTKVDSDGNVYADYENVATSTDTDGPGKLPNRDDAKSMIAGLQAINESVGATLAVERANKANLDKLLDGTLTAGNAERAAKAVADGHGNSLNALSYITDIVFSYNQSTGVITATGKNQNGVAIITRTIDLPSELIFDDQGYDADAKKLWFHPVGNASGKNVEIDVSDLFDVYSGGNTDTISVSVSKNIITATINDGSVTYAKLDSSMKTTWDGWANAEASRVKAETARVEAEAKRVQAESQRELNETARQNAYLFYIDAEGYVCAEYDNFRVMS